MYYFRFSVYVFLLRCCDVCYHCNRPTVEKHLQSVIKFSEYEQWLWDNAVKFARWQHRAEWRHMRFPGRGTVLINY